MSNAYSGALFIFRFVGVGPVEGLLLGAGGTSGLDALCGREGGAAAGEFGLRAVEQFRDTQNLDARIGAAGRVGIVSGGQRFGDHAGRGLIERDKQADGGIFALDDAAQVADHGRIRP